METAPSPAFAMLLRRYRMAAGLTQEELAERARLSVRTVGDRERGASHAPRKDTVELLPEAPALAPPEGGCQRRAGHEPSAPLLAAPRRPLSPASPAQQRTEPAGCAWLVRLLPELAGGSIAPLPASTLPPEQERRLMVDAVLRLLANVAGPAGTLLVLDDLQWAGPDALDLLTALVHAAAEVPLRVIGAYRDAEVQPQDPLAGTLADLAHAGLANQHTLAPLPAKEMRQLLEGLLEGVAVPAPVRIRLVQRTGGVPFYLISCARGLRAGVLDAQAAARLPWDLAQSI